MKHYPHYLGGRPQAGGRTLSVKNKFTGAVMATTGLAEAQDIDRAVTLALASAPALAKMASFERQNVLLHVVERCESRREELVQLLCGESGKPIRDARSEVARLIDTFRVAAEEAVRVGGEVLPLDISERLKGYRGMWKRVPVGLCSFIAPFNFPLNLVAHKIAPAIAAGCPFLLKPASRTPLGALVIAEILAETALPPGSFSVLPCEREAAGLFTTDERIKLLSFTGSAPVGWELKKNAGKKKVILELGGNAACVIDETADLEAAADRVAFGAYYMSGQSCISVQRILVVDSVYDQFREKLLKRVKALNVGDPQKEETFIGPLIDEKEAIRLEHWTREAVDKGAKILCGGGRNGALFDATLLESVPRGVKIREEEAFGPVALLDRVDSFEQALEQVNDSRFGLQAGVFTNQLSRALKAWDQLEVGGVVIGDVPAFRADNMPYGGVKESGLGREGLRFAIEDMTEIRMLVIKS